MAYNLLLFAGWLMHVGLYQDNFVQTDTIIMKHKLQFYTSYHQFYVCDKVSSTGLGSENFWTEHAVEDRLALEQGIVGVGTECYGPVNAEICIIDAPNSETNFDKYDHVVEGSIELKSGILQVLDCPDSEVHLEIALPPGYYCVRVYSSIL